MKLTAKQERFCQEYVVDFNATKAAIRAGYSEKTAHQIGANNLKNTAIMGKIDELRGKAEAKAEVTAEWITRQLKQIAETGEKDSDKVSALDKLAKRIGYYEVDNKQKTDTLVTISVLPAEPQEKPHNAIDPEADGSE